MQQGSSLTYCIGCGAHLEMTDTVCPLCGIDQTSGASSTEHSPRDYEYEEGGEPLDYHEDKTSSAGQPIDISYSEIEPSARATVPWLWWRILLKSAFALGVPAFMAWFAVSTQLPSWWFLTAAAILYPGMLAVPVLLYRSPVVVSEKGFSIFKIPFSWQDIRDIWVFDIPRVRSTVAFEYTDSCRVRLLSEVPLPKRIMMKCYLPIVAIFPTKNFMALPTNLDISARRLFRLMVQWKSNRN